MNPFQFAIHIALFPWRMALACLGGAVHTHRVMQAARYRREEQEARRAAELAQ